jgi:ribosomal protein S9
MAEKFYGTGRRKSSVARVTISKGSGNLHLTEKIFSIFSKPKYEDDN